MSAVTWGATGHQTGDPIRLAVAEGSRRLVRPLLDRGHTLLGAAVLAGQQLTELHGDDVVGDLDPGGQLGLRSHGVVDGPFDGREVACGARLDLARGNEPAVTIGRARNP